MEEAQVIVGEARSHAEMVRVLRARKKALGLTDMVVDELAGLCGGHTAKVMTGRRRPGYVSLGALLGAMGLKLLIVEDPEQIARVSARWTPRRRSYVRDPQPEGAAA